MAAGHSNCEMKSTNQKMIWNAQDMNMSRYVHKANMHLTIRGISILHH